MIILTPGIRLYMQNVNVTAWSKTDQMRKLKHNLIATRQIYPFFHKYFNYKYPYIEVAE